MDETVSPIVLLQEFLHNAERMITMDAQSVSDYKGLTLELKSWVEQLEQQAVELNQDNADQGEPKQLNDAEIQELTELKAEKVSLLGSIEEKDAQLLKMLTQLRRIQFSIDAMDPSVYQRPMKPRQ